MSPYKNSPYEWIQNHMRELFVKDDKWEACTKYKSALLAHNCKHAPNTDDNLNTTQTLEYTKDKYNAKIIK
jgi:hypothetical protein